MILESIELHPRLRNHGYPYPFIDIFVGEQLRFSRMTRGLSQTALGNAVGVTFQQVQKYERGTNRIGASRLFAIAQVLGVPISSFFSKVPATISAEPVEELRIDPLDLKIIRALSQIRSQRLKVHLLKFLQGLGSGDLDVDEDAD
jgi:transcriptional regulator with XRE-family HTH domain